MATTISPEAPAVVEEQKTRKRKPSKPHYELAEGIKLEATPEDFDGETHSLKRSDFKDMPCYMEHQALMSERRAVKLRIDAAEYRINPPKRDGAKKAKLVARLSKLEAKLQELGVNLDDLFADED